MKDDITDAERRIERDIASGKLISREEFENRCVGDLAQLNRRIDLFIVEAAKALAAKHGLDVSDVAASLRTIREFQFESSERALRTIRELK
jgi:hypothetical protein